MTLRSKLAQINAFGSIRCDLSPGATKNGRLRSAAGALVPTIESSHLPDTGPAGNSSLNQVTHKLGVLLELEMIANFKNSSAKQKRGALEDFFGAEVQRLTSDLRRNFDCGPVTSFRGINHARYFSARSIFSILLLSIILPGCSENVTGTGKIDAEACSASVPTTSSARRLAHPRVPSECVTIVMLCNYCQYDARGLFEKVGSEICGVCLGADF